MRLLLDTHTLLWALSDPDRLTPSTREKLSARRNQVFASAVCAWEMEIKRGLGKLTTPDDLAGELRTTGFEELPVRVAHVHALRGLPPHHRDPFDRLLVAQALVEDLVVVTSDSIIPRYPVRTLRA